MKRAAALGALVIALVHAGDARAEGDKAAAEALFQQAKALMSAGKYAEACPKFEESDRIDPGIGTKLRLADCYALVGRTASAWAEFVDAADLAAKQKDAREKIARKKAADLEPNLPKLTITITGSKEGLAITRDGLPVGAGMWNTAVPVDPGVHEIGASAPNKKPWTVRVLTEPGRTASLTVPELEASVAAASEPAPAPQPERGPARPVEETASPGSTQRTIGLVVLGVGVVGLGVGGYFGLQAKSKLDESNDGHCRSGNRCDATGVKLRDDFQGAATISTIAFVAGGAALVGGGVLYLTAPSGVTIAPTGSGVLVRGSF